MTDQMAYKPIGPATAELDSFEPDYKETCEVCNQSPTVTGLHKGKVVYRSGMCGVCTFGTARALATDWWNSNED